MSIPVLETKFLRLSHTLSSRVSTKLPCSSLPPERTRLCEYSTAYVGTHNILCAYVPTGRSKLRKPAEYEPHLFKVEGIFAKFALNGHL